MLDFLQVFHLDFTLAVFQPEINSVSRRQSDLVYHCEITVLPHVKCINVVHCGRRIQMGWIISLIAWTVWSADRYSKKNKGPSSIL